MAIDLKKRRFTVTEYHQMAQAGILGEDDRVELIEGEIVEMTPIGARHASCVARLDHYLGRELGDAAVTWPQNPVRLGEHSEPEPDLALLRPRADFYASGHPGPEDIFLLVEVADSSADPDRRVKVPLYARSGVPEVWLADLQQQTITIYRDPTPEGYRTVRVVRRGEGLTPGAFPDCALAVADILPD